MKHIFFVCVLTLLSMCAFSQRKVIDSLNTAYKTANTDSAQADILWQIGNTYSQTNPDSELFKAQQLLFFSQRIKSTTGELRALKQIAESYQKMGNYSQSLDFYLQRLRMDEKYPYPEQEAATLLSIAGLYQSEGDYVQALVYMKKAYAFIDKNKLENYRWYSFTYFGDFYEQINNIPKAINYDSMAYNLALKKNNESWMGMSLNNTGNAYSKNKQYKEALNYYNRAAPFLKKDNNESFLCENYAGIARIFYHTKKLDSAVFYAKKSLKLARDRNFSNYSITSLQLLSDIYKEKKLADSAVIYQGKLLTMKDSIYSQDKARQIENLTVMEKFRQKDLQQQKLIEEKHTTYKLNMLLIGLLIPFFFLISVILSRRKIKRNIVEFSGIISLLLLFEYLNLLLHHFIGPVTDDSPLLEITLLVIIAAILTPSHHRVEKWMLHQLAHRSNVQQPAIAKVRREQPNRKG
ncbi:MAG TPA: tetratricopeptide repeat protein [Mucilaginibacter sp.]|jgi:tetratricopeptide (TPR) repeat protein